MTADHRFIIISISHVSIISHKHEREPTFNVTHKIMNVSLLSPPNLYFLNGNACDFYDQSGRLFIT
jgi:hypothetical protein